MVLKTSPMKKRRLMYTRLLGRLVQVIIGRDIDVHGKRADAGENIENSPHEDGEAESAV